MPGETPTLMEALRDQMRHAAGSNPITLTINAEKPNVAIFSVGSGNNRIDMTVTHAGNQIHIKPSRNDAANLNPQVLKDAYDRVGKVLGLEPLGVNSPDITRASNADHGYPAITKRVSPEQANKVIDTELNRRAIVGDTISMFRNQQTMLANGVRPELAQAQTNHAIGLANANSDPHSLMTGQRALSPLDLEGRAAHSEMERLLGRASAPTPKPASPSTGPIIIPGADVRNAPAPAEMGALLNRPARITEHAPAPHAAPVHAETHAAQPHAQQPHIRSGSPLLRALGGAAAAFGAAVPAFAKAPDGEGFKEAAKAGGKAFVENALPGITSEDACEKRKAEWGALGGTLGSAALGTAGAVGGLVATPVGSAVVGAAGTVVGGELGGRMGETLADNVCRMARAAVNGENMTQAKYTPEQAQHANKNAPQVRVAQNLTTAAGRG